MSCIQIAEANANMAQVLTGSFILRLFSLAKHGLLPKSLASDLETQAPNFYAWAQNVIKHPSVYAIFDEESNVKKTRERVEKLKGAV